MRRLADVVVPLQWDRLSRRVRHRALLTLTDTVGTAVAGARTAELRRLLAAWDPPPGPARLFGTGRHAGVDDATWLNGTALCTLELDEGNKHAQGHPGAHVAPSTLAVAQATGASGPELLTAFVAGYEVAARFGRAVTRRPELHTHGHWGAAGSAAAVARLRGLDAACTAAAVDAATGLVLVTPWPVVMAGSFVRNLWAAGAGVAGIVGTRLAVAGLAEEVGTSAHTLGSVVGRLDPDRLVEGLSYDLVGGSLLTEGYVKRHASCSYTHPAADAVLRLRDEGLRPEDVTGVRVETHALAAPLAPLATRTRLAAMFSIPYVVAVALLDGEVAPGGFDDARRQDRDVLAMAERVAVEHTADLDTRLPAERVSRVTVWLRDGSTRTVEQPNPVGDADHEPFGPAEVHAKLERLLGAADAQRVVDAVAQLPAAQDVRPVLDALP